MINVLSLLLLFSSRQECKAWGIDGHKIVAIIGDQGGNLIHVTTNFGPGMNGKTESNLHAVWDSVIIEEYLRENKKSHGEFANSIIEKIAMNEFSRPSFEANCMNCFDDAYECPITSAKESAELACSMAYVDVSGEKIHSGQHIGRDYYLSRLAEIEKRLAAAGVRLAATLNQAFGGKTVAALMPEIQVF
jgi:hypothetical protein